jgi:hypothetical protein
VDPITNAAVNFGAMGVAFAAIYFLHRDAIAKFCDQSDKDRKVYEEQMRIDRQVNQETWNRHLDLQLRNHEKQLEAIARIHEGFIKMRVVEEEIEKSRSGEIKMTRS